jgi:hypothetical protein
MASLYDSIRSMERSGSISKATAKAFSRTPDRTIQMPPLDRVLDDPDFLCVLIDDSGSMNKVRQAVIDAHAHFLQPFRKSAKCRHDGLFVAQYLFSDTSRTLNSFTQLSTNGHDQVVRLTPAEYTAAGKTTALYQAVYRMLQDSLMVVDHCRSSENLVPQLSIGLMTDGEDKEGGVDPADIRRCLDEMREKNSLGVATVLGLTNDKLSEAQAENIRATLGFDLVISAGATEKEVRKAMGWLSESIAARMRK